MERTEEGIGIKVYIATPSEGPTISIFSLPRLPPESCRKRKDVAKGVQENHIQNFTLVDFLPTGTLLTFEMILPSVFRNGDCSSVNTMVIYFLFYLCALSCFFFHFNDSFRSRDGKVYYGFVTPNGLAVFKPGFGVETQKGDKFNLGLTDSVHAIMSVLVFLAIMFSDRRVISCVFPGHEKEMDQVTESFPLMGGIICSSLFLVLPNTRYGDGCMAD